PTLHLFCNPEDNLRQRSPRSTQLLPLRLFVDAVPANARKSPVYWTKKLSAVCRTDPSPGSLKAASGPRRILLRAAPWFSAVPPARVKCVEVNHHSQRASLSRPSRFQCRLRTNGR